MTYQLTVEAVGPTPRDWASSYGNFKAFTITVKDLASGSTRDVEWSRKVKPDGSFSTPQVGDRLEAELKKIPQPPGWKLQNVKFGEGMPATSTANQGGGGGGWDDATVRRVVVQSADRTAAILMLANTQGGIPWNMTDFEELSGRLQARALGEQQQPGPSPQLPEVRRDIERTGGSDVPVDPQEFQPVATGADDDIPF